VTAGGPFLLQDDAMTDSDARIRWQCRRGMRELDELLTAYFEQAYGDSSAAEKAAFRELLSLPDPELAGYLVMGQGGADGVSARVISRIRNRPCPGDEAP
jgi:antitoxin CptB